MADRPILFSGPMVRALLEGRKTQTRRVLKPQPKVLKNGSWYRPFPTTDPLNWQYALGDRIHGYLKAPYAVGDRLWVREAWQYRDWTDDGEPFIRFRADEAEILARPDPDWADRLEDIWCSLSGEENYGIDNRAADRRWRPGIHMPRWASRLMLEVTDVRVQRLQEIGEADAVAEGCSARVGETWWQGYRDVGDGPLLHQTHPGDEPPSWMIEPKPAGRSDWADRTAVEDFRSLWDHLNAERGFGWEVNPWVVAVSFAVRRGNIDEFQ